jgi:hypothetical protein
MTSLINLWQDMYEDGWTLHFFDIHYQNEGHYSLVIIVILNFGVKIYWVNTDVQ